METINDITQDFGTLYHPKSALVFYESKGSNTDVYVEHFDMDKNGNPINAHPLTVKEANVLAKALNTEQEKNKTFLKSNGILPNNILHINPNADKGAVVWYTKAQQRQLYFVESLGIPNGKAPVPPMLWKASKNGLSVFALSSDRRPTEKTKLYHTPYFNIYEDGKVCMGTVSVDIKKSASVEEFIQAWEHYFFNSYFSHLLGNHTPIKGNCVTLWKDLVNSDKPFPKEVLKPSSKTLKNLL
ncbi:PRTRC system protein B [Flavobacterium akiainvivens]|uniref:PRTRC system protein B n=1 Tax=Flavobacterium akiainvivens TaxID=1202724 RepID=A0A0M8MFM8_9FLAO|nr:PRTRC system protein B [Flavobacterium akiainvivens]KOS05261.1 PRTRC system protein B [Flavobacterium akiainvivens]SFQ49971.1 PRTRC system protein B [Flavobacterium akiainvivens]